MGHDKLLEVINSLPLTERQRELAMETMQDATPEEVERIVASYDKLVETLPKALAAIKRIKSNRSTNNEASK